MPSDADFLGYAVIVTLKSPPNFRIQGDISGVIPGKQLTLRNAILPGSKQKTEIFNVQASGIENVEVLSQEPSSSEDDLPLPRTNSSQKSHTLASPPPPSATSSFIDPAIVSFTGPPPVTNVPSQPAKSMVDASPFARMLGESNMISRSGVSQTHNDLIKNFGFESDGVDTVAKEIDDSKVAKQLPVRENALKSTKTSRSSSKRPASVQKKEKEAEEAAKTASRNGSTNGNRQPGILPIPVSLTNASSGSKNKGKYSSQGWRNTALVEPIESSPAQNSKDKQKRQKNRRQNRGEVNGWATEEASDIQELGDFDFASNLSKFDKPRVFDEIRGDDQVRADERLYSFNRRAKPGTNGGRNLHYTENVIDKMPPIDQSDDDNDWVARGRGSRRPQSRLSRTSLQTQKSKKDSVATHSRQSMSSRTISPGPSKLAPELAQNGSFYLSSTKRVCPCISPLQMLEIEQLAASDEIGMTEEILNENAGRSIAEVAITNANNLSKSSTILVFAGNHKTGIRAAVAARHLRNRLYRVTLCVLGVDSEDDMLQGFNKQLNILRNIGSRVIGWQDLAMSLYDSDHVPDLIIDALFGIHHTFEDLRADEERNAFEIISWANRSNIEKMSVDIPSGMSATTGQLSVSKSFDICVHSNVIICLGAPKLGVQHAFSRGDGKDWQVFVTDIGLSQVVWRKYGSRRRHGVEFGDQWVVKLKYQLPPFKGEEEGRAKRISKERGTFIDGSRT